MTKTTATIQEMVELFEKALKSASWFVCF